MHVCVWTCVHVAVRGRCWVSSVALHLSFWDRVCHWTCNSLTRLDRLASKSQGPSCHYFPRTGITGTYHCTQLFIYELWGSNFGLYECVASTLPTEPSPQSLIFYWLVHLFYVLLTIRCFIIHVKFPCCDQIAVSQSDIPKERECWVSSLLMLFSSRLKQNFREGEEPQQGLLWKHPVNGMEPFQDILTTCHVNKVSI